MSRKAAGLVAVVGLTLGLTTRAVAFPFPPFQCPWHEAPDCPKGSYCCLHYLLPSIYRYRACHTEPRYVYGCPVDPTYTGFRLDTYPCRITSPDEQAANYLQYRNRDVKVPESAANRPERFRETPDEGPGQAGTPR